MASVFTSIINGDLPGRIVHTDDVCVAFLTIEPLSPGHTLVVPRAEVDHWIDLDPRTMSHLAVVSQRVGVAIAQVFMPSRVGMMIVGLDVPHVHIHVTGIDDMSDLDFAGVDRSPNPRDLDEAQRRLTDALSM